MSTELMSKPSMSPELQEKVLLGGDLSKLTPTERLSYYNNICLSLDLNPLTRPFEYIVLNGKLTLYARKDCTEQLRTKRQVSVTILSREVVEGVYVVTAKATDVTGRSDESIGAVPIDKVVGNDRANAMMKAETKAKRRVTLSICGLGMLDETELETIKSARHPVAEAVTTGALPNIPDVRIPSPNAKSLEKHRADALRTISIDRYTGEPVSEDGSHADAESLNTAPPVNPARGDAPAPQAKSAAEYAMQQAEKVGSNERTVVGFISSFAPYSGERSGMKGVKPGFFDVETEDGQIALAQVRYFDPAYNAQLNQPGPLTITYTTELYKGQTQYKLLKVEAEKAED